MRASWYKGPFRKCRVLESGWKRRTRRGKCTELENAKSSFAVWMIICKQRLCFWFMFTATVC